MKPTQTQRAYKMLQKAGKHGVKNFQFAERGILRYGAVIELLRKEGYHIITERQHLPNGRATNVWNYTLTEE